MTKLEQYKMRRRKLASMLKYTYKRHPKIASLLQERYKLYNDTLSYIHSEKSKENLFIIQPSSRVPVRRIERNQVRLKELYELGYSDAKDQLQQLDQFLNN